MSNSAVWSGEVAGELGVRGCVIPREAFRVRLKSLLSSGVAFEKSNLGVLGFLVGLEASLT